MIGLWCWPSCAQVEISASSSSVPSPPGSATKPVAIVSSWGSNEELAAFHAAFGAKVPGFVKADHLPLPGEVVEDHLLIKPDKNPNRKAALALYPALPERVSDALPADTDVVLVWGEGFDSALVPSGAKVIRLDSYVHAANAAADVFIPISVQTERSGHYTNFNGVVTPFEACFPVKPSIVHAETLFGQLTTGTGA